MAAIGGPAPGRGRRPHHHPTPEELARTYPPASGATADGPRPARPAAAVTAAPGGRARRRRPVGGRRDPLGQRRVPAPRAWAAGTVIGGRAGLALDPGLLARLAAGRPVALVSGTNGKTTTTRLLAVALGRARPAGGDQRHRLQHAGRATWPPWPRGPGPGRWCSRSTRATCRRWSDAVRPAVVVLLNLSRDQLDRTNEVRMLAGRWRAGPGRAPTETTVVANADDPLVVWGAGTARRVVWVAAGLRWRADAVGCPACEGRIAFAEGPTGPGGPGAPCGFARPDPRRGASTRPGRRRDLVGPTAGGCRSTLGAPGPLQPGQRGHGGRGRRGPRGRRRPTALAAMAAVDRGGRPLHHRRGGRRPDPAAAGQEPGRVGRAARPGRAGPPSRWWWASTPGWPTAGTRRGCGTCPSSGWPGGRWWPPGSAAGTCRCACATPRWPTRPCADPARPSGRARGPSARPRRRRSTSSATTPPSATCWRRR